MADETLSCTGCGAALSSSEDYCAKCGRKSVHLSVNTENTTGTAEAGETVPEHTFIVYGNAVIPTAEEVAQYEASQSYELPPLNIYDWIFTPAEAWERRPDALRQGGWGWYAGLCSVGAVFALMVLSIVSRGTADRLTAQATAGNAPTVLGASRVMGPSLASAPGPMPPAVAAVSYTPPPTPDLKAAPLYRIENGHYAVLTVEEERQAAREAVAWEQQGQLSATTRRTDSIVKAAQRQAAQSASSNAQGGLMNRAQAR